MFLKMTESKIKKERDNVHSIKGHLLYSLGAIPSALPYNMIGTWLLTFYTIGVGLSLIEFGFLFIIYGIWNAVNDPLFGFFMDKLKPKKGRRVPWIIYGTIPMTLGFIGLWWVPFTAHIGILLYGLAMLFIFDTGFTICMTAWGALYTEMYETERERASVVAVKDTFAFISSMIGVMIPSMIAAALGSWALAGLIMGITIPITMYLSLLGTKERKEYQIDEPLPILKAFIESFSNKPFVISAVTYALLDFCFGFTMMIIPLYAKFIIHIGEGMEGFAMIGVALGILGGIPIWWKIYAKKGPKFGLAYSMLVFCIGMIPLFLAGDFITLLIIGLFPGIGVAGVLMTEPVISAAIDYDEIKTGKRREATYGGIQAFVARLSLILSAVALIILQLVSGFNPNLETQTTEGLIGLRFSISIVPAIGLILALIIFKFYPLNLKKFNEQQAKLKELHQARLSQLKK
ncbi:MAG: MFS transporter [Candidatus Lokiarchaeota archaeon]|nr:MFS transporter [Candidatus Lokiarchaeota archaeon]